MVRLKVVADRAIVRAGGVVFVRREHVELHFGPHCAEGRPQAQRHEFRCDRVVERCVVGAVWCGVVWCGVVWCGDTSVIWCCVARARCCSTV